MTKEKLIIVVILSILMGQNYIFGQQNKKTNRSNYWNISLQWLNYNSYSQQKNDFPIKAGYPVLLAHTSAFSIGYIIDNPKKDHEFTLKLGLPTSLSSDNGSGENHILNQDKSGYTRLGFDYSLTMNLFAWNKFKIRHSFLSGLLYESRQLTYSSGSEEITKDFNIYIGPGFQLLYHLNPKLNIEGGFDGRFYLPYLNYGKLQTFDHNGKRILSTNYRAFYYQAIFKLGFAYQITGRGVLEFGIKKNDLIGFANRRPLFYVNDLVHFKLDRLFNIYLCYQF